jgi:hypothetical protein
MTTGRPHSIEHRCRPSGRLFSGPNSRGLAVRDQHDQISGWYVVLVDVDDVKRPEGAIRGVNAISL